MRNKFQSIQYLRAFAALIVVFHHARNPEAGLYDPIERFVAGQAGVDIFFVISGFIMYESSRYQRPLSFISRRLVRIAPLYWIATIILTLQLLHHNHFAFGAGAWPDFAKSILFIPHYSLMFPGNIYPILIPGWTLNYEMFFYLMFAIGLMFRRPVACVTISMLLLVVAGLLHASQKPLWITYTDPLLLEFLAGMYIARCRHFFDHAAFIALLPLGLVAIGLSGLVGAPRVLVWGVPAAAIVIGALACEGTHRLPDIAWLNKLGDASYSIYLFQIFAINAAYRLIVRLPLHGPMQLILMIAFSLLAATAAGLIAYQLFERPINRYLLRRRPLGRVEVQAAP